MPAERKTATILQNGVCLTVSSEVKEGKQYLHLMYNKSSYAKLHVYNIQTGGLGNEGDGLELLESDTEDLVIRMRLPLFVETSGPENGKYMLKCKGEELQVQKLEKRLRLPGMEVLLDVAKDEYEITFGERFDYGEWYRAVANSLPARTSGPRLPRRLKPA